MPDRTQNDPGDHGWKPPDYTAKAGINLAAVIPWIARMVRKWRVAHARPAEIPPNNAGKTR